MKKYDLQFFFANFLILLSCNTSDIATCFANVVSGGDIDLTPGTMNTWDGLYSETQLSLYYKYGSIACSEDGGVCVWQGATGKCVVLIGSNGGTSTLSHLVVKDGDPPSGSGGGGLVVDDSNVVLIIVAFIDNAATIGGAIYVLSSTGSSSVTATLQGCSFAGNTATSERAPDVFNSVETVVISGCPAGEDKPTRPSPPFVPSLTNSPPLPPPPSSLRRFYSNPRFRPGQRQLLRRRRNDHPRVLVHLYSNFFFRPHHIPHLSVLHCRYIWTEWEGALHRLLGRKIFQRCRY